MEGKYQNLSLQKKVSNTYTLRLGYDRNSIFNKDIKKNNDMPTFKHKTTNFILFIYYGVDIIPIKK